MSNIKPADRLSAVQEYYFSRKLKEVAALNAQGKDIISLAIGSPDMPPSRQTVDALCRTAEMPRRTDISRQWVFRSSERPWPTSTEGGMA